MQFEVNNEAKQRDIRVLWIQILDLLDRLMNANKRDQLVSPFPMLRLFDVIVNVILFSMRLSLKH